VSESGAVVSPALTRTPHRQKEPPPRAVKTSRGAQLLRNYLKRLGSGVCVAVFTSAARHGRMIDSSWSVGRLGLRAMHPTFFVSRSLLVRMRMCKRGPAAAGANDAICYLNALQPNPIWKHKRLFKWTLHFVLALQVVLFLFLPLNNVQMRIFCSHVNLMLNVKHRVVLKIILRRNTPR
jgi:hypothetical protein